MREILQFLRDLSRNNNREWFLSNKQRYQQVQSRWYAYCEALVSAIGQYDSDIASLTIKDCTYRIHRDTRFSPDKSPYKTHFGAFICRGGKKSPYSGYYFQVGIDGPGNFEGANMLATGNYWLDPRALKVLREDISMGGGEFGKLVKECDPCFEMEFEGALKKVPAGFPADCPDADYLRLKRYCVTYCAPDSFMTSEGLLERSAELFRTTKPLLHYINRGIEYAVEEQGLEEFVL